MAVEMYIEEKEIQKEIKVMSHPYYGLTDNMGSLMRYPKHVCRIPRWWMEKYINNGGSCDSERIWGESPEDYKLKYVDPIIWGQMTKLLGRVDDLNKNKIELYTEILNRYNPQNAEDYYRVIKGYTRKDILSSYGFKYTNSVLTLGWMSMKRFAQYVAKHIENPFRNGMFGEIYIHEIELVDGELCIIRYNVYGEYNIPLDFGKWNDYIISCKLKNDERHHWTDKLSADADYEMSDKSIRHFLNGTDFLHMRNIGLRPKVYYIRFGRKSYKFFKNDYIVDWNTHERVPIRKIGKYFVFADGDTYHVWINDTTEHVSASSIKEAMYLLERVERKNRLELKLNDVRGDKPHTSGFCLPGTKAFLEDRMPFVYNLIKDYNKWSDIPEDIMEIEWKLTDKSIFAGYPIP